MIGMLMLPSKFIFADDIELNEAKDVFIGRLPIGVHSAIALLDLIASTLHFPSYFGGNWNALYDCLRDFDWVKSRAIYLIHHELPKLPDNELKIYLEILRDASEDWNIDEPHELHVVFPNSEKGRIIQLLSTS
jgi:RNAse (barnase) inhibitor barstar